ncbi:36_t:CDS:2 [Dentiscutata erythropus]|uniref:36_t:CDS:1 n=1 Tax=Dentiscutata erythropus TaxID=1348616 RepID=A0A9N9DM61_9GLOM|nr:36_t:CDS:2 [Dentiscutata erythropus]
MSSKDLCSENAQPRGIKRPHECIESSKEKRTRASVICEACKISRRKCHGWDSSVEPLVGCSECIRKNIICKLPNHCKVCKKKLIITGICPKCKENENDTVNVFRNIGYKQEMELLFKKLGENEAIVKKLKEQHEEDGKKIKKLEEDVKRLEEDFKNLEKKAEESNKEQNQSTVQQFDGLENDQNSYHNYLLESAPHESDLIGSNNMSSGTNSQIEVATLENYLKLYYSFDYASELSRDNEMSN